MRRLTMVLLLVPFLATPALAQRTKPPSKDELAQISDRGSRLAEYDVAAWYATDAVVELKPAAGAGARYICLKKGKAWTVAFGRLNEARDKFLVEYEATQGASPKQFSARKLETPREETGYFLFAARAIEAALADFKGESRPYNVAVLSADSSQMYVYVFPAQTKEGVFPLGADARYLVSADGTTIVEKRRLHVSVIEFSQSSEVKTVQGSFHTAVLDDIPEDTDVFHVLSRTPAVPEWVATKRFVFLIETDGTIKYVTTTEAFLKNKGK